ncbi:MAG: MFS transporter [Acidobacteriota bacterium]
MTTQPTPAVPTPDPLSMGEVLRIPALRRMWYAQIVSVFGDFVALYAVITVMTFQLHATAQQITGVQIAYLLPIALLGILSGVFVDRWPLKITMVASDYTRAALCLLLLLVHNVYDFYFVLASISIFSSFFSPAQGVAIRSVVPLHGLRSSTALMQQVMFILRIIGGPTAVFLTTVIGPRGCYLIDALSFVASGSFILSLALKVPAKPAPTGSAAKSGIARILSDMKEGSSFIFHHAALFFVILALASGMFVMGCFGPLIAVYVRDILHANTKIFGITSAMIGAGLLIGINLLNTFAKRVRHTILVYCGLTGIALGTAILAFIPHLPATIAGLFLIGFAAGGIIVPSQTMIQEETPAAMLGRVGSTVMSLIFSAQIAGLILSGILANYTSVRRVFALCTLMLLALVVIGKLWMEPDHPNAAA